MIEGRPVGRRRVLRAAAAAGALPLAGCAGALGGPTAAADTGTQTPSATATPTAAATAEPTPTATASPTRAPAVTVDVGPAGSLAFEPRTFTVGVADPVAWAFRSAGHNVKPGAVPENAAWTGTPGGAFDVMPVGYVHRETFAVAGDYAYSCVPHRSAGMAGSFTVER